MQRLLGLLAAKGGGRTFGSRLSYIFIVWSCAASNLRLVKSLTRFAAVRQHDVLQRLAAVVHALRPG